MLQSSFLNLLFFSLYIPLDYLCTPIKLLLMKLKPLSLYPDFFHMSYKPMDHCLSDILIKVSHWYLNSANPKQNASTFFYTCPFCVFLSVILPLSIQLPTSKCEHCPWFLSCPPHLITCNQPPVQPPFWISLHSSSSRGLLSYFAWSPTLIWTDAVAR